MQKCVSEDTLLAFVDGRTTSAERAAVEAHLCDCRTCQQVVAALNATTAPEEQGAPQPAIGEVVDDYCIERVVGRGGMGQVYVAKDARLDRDVALKFCTTASASTAKRIEREAVALAGLAHPNVVVVYGVGEWRGQFYIAMEYVDGGNAREWLRARPRTWREIVALYAAAGDGLAAANARGFVHRDFKPDNVLVGSDGRPRVADFGLVGADTSSSGEVPRPALAPLTRHDTVLGTVGYMAPEQLAGAAIDARADQYAFCVALWEALFGRRPSSDAPDSSTTAGGKGVPRRIVAALRRGLAKDRERRWPAMEQLVAELRRERRAPRVALAIAAVVAGGGVASFALWPRSDGAIVCPPADPAAREVYVDASSPADPGNGTVACPFRTITRALATRARVVHVAAGTYDAKLGEQFPLVVRGERRVVGAGSAKTRVIGTGRFDPRGTSVGTSAIDATVIAGDDRAVVGLDKLAIARGERGAVDSFGVICDRGDLGPNDSSPATQPPPSFVANEIDVSGFDVGLAIATTPAGTGCNARVEHATLHDDRFGIWMLGCGATDDTPAHPPGAGLDVEATRFAAMRGAGIAVWDCARWLVVRDSHFRDGDVGIDIVNHGATATTNVIVERDEFAALRSHGIAVSRAAAIDRLVGNTFSVISAGTPRSLAERAAGLVIDGGNEEQSYPAVRYARDNRFVDNDVGIELRGRFPVRGTFDFGRADDPGRNVLRCNATVDGAAVAGHDVVVRAPLDASAKLLFAGNTWDHAPPSAGTTNGADLELGGDARALDASDARAGKDGCSVRAP